MRGVVLCSILLAGCATRKPIDPSVPFEERWNAWATVANERAKRPGSIDAREKDLWEAMKAHWESFRSEMDAYYRGMQ